MVLFIGALCGGEGGFASRAVANGLQVFATLGTVLVEQVEGNLRIEDGLANGLKREQVRGLCLEFLDARTTCFGDGAEENYCQTGKAEVRESMEESTGDETGSGGNRVESTA